MRVLRVRLTEYIDFGLDSESVSYVYLYPSRDGPMRPVNAQSALTNSDWLVDHLNPPGLEASVGKVKSPDYPHIICTQDMAIQISG